MILPKTTYEDIIKNFRVTVSEQSGVALDRIFNATSVRGPDIIKIINETNATSFNLADCFIVFELLEDYSETDNVVTHESDGTISSISSFNFNLKIYGNACHSVSQTILMRLKTDEVALALRSKGIYISGIPFPAAINEFVNNTVWPRCDMTIKMKVRFNISPAESTGLIHSSSGIIIKTIEKASEA